MNDTISALIFALGMWNDHPNQEFIKLLNDEIRASITRHEQAEQREQRRGSGYIGPLPQPAPIEEPRRTIWCFSSRDRWGSMTWCR